MLMLRLLLLCSIATVIFGCGKPEVEAVAGAKPPNPEREMYDNLRSARFQIGAANERLSDVFNQVSGLAEQEEAEVHDALKEISDGISKAGSLVADYDEELPPYDKFQADFSAQDDERLKAIEACSKALGEVEDALNLTDDLLESGPPEEPAKVLREVKNGLEECRDALKDAVADMGGTSEEPS